MNEDHLTDELLQQYIDNPSFTEQDTIIHHMNQCRECNKRFETFLILKNYLKLKPSEDFSLEFEDNILSKLEENPIGDMKFKSTILSAVIILGCILSYLFILPDIRNIVIHSFDLTFEAANNFYHEFVDSIHIVQFSLFTIIILGLFDWKNILVSFTQGKK